MNAHTLWYMTRATGIVALVLLSAVTVLGILTAVRLSTSEWPRFAWQDLHRRLSLVAVVFVGLHVTSTVLDGYAPIGWLSAFVPFTSPYRRLWLGLGTVAVDLLLAVGVSSLLRSRIRAGTWRALHWLAYVSWPVAVLHALGTGTDPRLHWVIGLVVICVAAVVASVVWRLRGAWPTRPALRTGAVAAGVVGVVAAGAWAAGGPLRPGWAARAGTPASLLARSASATASGASPASSAGQSGSPTSAGAPSTLPSAPFEASLDGTIAQRSLSGGQVEVDLSATASGGARGVLSIRLVGTPDGAGGVAMQAGQASFGPPGAPGEFQGTVVGLEGSRIDLALADNAGTPLDLRVSVAVQGSTLSGTLLAIDSSQGGDR